MQFQRQSIRVVEGCHLLASVISHTDWLTFNPNFCQFSHRLLHTVYAECKVTQTAGLWAVHTLRRIFLCEKLQFRVFIDTQIQLSFLTLWTIVLSDNRESQLVHIEILCSFVVRYDDCNMMYF